MNRRLLWFSNKKHSIYLSSIKFYVQFLIVKWSESKYFSCFSNHLMTKYVFLHLPGHGGWRCSSLYTKGERIQIVKSMLYHVPRNRFSLLWSKYLIKWKWYFVLVWAPPGPDDLAWGWYTGELVGHQNNLASEFLAKEQKIIKTSGVAGFLIATSSLWSVIDTIFIFSVQPKLENLHHFYF